MMVHLMPDSRVSVSKWNRLLWLSASALVLYVFVCTFPDVWQPSTTGLDESWRSALASLRESGTFLFGRQVVFTYGPLGFLLNPRITSQAATCVIPALFWLAMHVCLFAVICARLRMRIQALSLFFLFFLFLCALGLWIESRFALTIYALSLFSLERTRLATVSGALASVLTAVAFDVKWSLWLASLGFLAGCWILLWLHKTPKARPTLLVGIAAYLITTIGLQLTLFRTLADFRHWIVVSVDLMRGYGAAMSITGETLPLIQAGLALISLLLLLYLVTPSSKRRLYLFTPVLLVAFKEGFVRQDGHRLVFFLTIAMTPALLSLSSELSMRDRNWSLLTFIAACALSTWYGSSFEAFPALRTADVARSLQLSSGMEHLRNLVSLLNSDGRSRLKARDNLAADVLSPEWRQAIGQSSVSIVPWELNIAVANQLKWQPLPTLQLYSAYTALLDQVTADSIRDHGARYLIVDFIEIDGRNLVLDNPLTWRGIAQQYEVQAMDTSSQRLLLSRKTMTATPVPLDQLSTGNSSFDEWVDVPAETRSLFAAVHIKNSLIGRLAETFYQLPPLYIKLQRSGGQISVHRILTRTAGNGMLINFTPETGSDYARLSQQGTSGDPVKRFLITTLNKSAFFQRQYSWQLLAQKGSEASSQAPAPRLITAVMPQKGEGRSASLEVTVTDPMGVAGLKWLQILVNKDLNGSRACYVSYEVSKDQVGLIADQGQGSAGVGRPAEHRTLENSQCRIVLDRVQSSIEKNLLKLTLQLDFHAGFSGKREIFVYATDQSGATAAWQSRAVWRVN